MKHIRKLCLVLCLALILQMVTVSSFAVAPKESAALGATVSSIVAELEANDTSISQELNHMITDYRLRAMNTEDEIERQQLLQAAAETESVLLKYERQTAGNTTYGSPAVEAKYAVAIAAIIAWFSGNGYSLAAELLAHADENQNPNSSYYPVNRAVAMNSSQTRSIINSTATSGSGNYRIRDNADLYYAIHLFDWEKDSTSLIITDIYDYELGDPSYSDLSGQAVNAMALAQSEGAIVPYEVIIRISI